MDISVEDGLYVVAVSGGVDSMVLLDLLHKKPGISLIVAHFDHGIRKYATGDENLVAQVASRYGLKLEVGRGNLGPHASEAKAREARYRFLEAVRAKYSAKAIITAHHQDDLLETALINIIRGTGRRGLSSMASNKQLIRPLLPYPKIKLIKYAKRHGLRWLDDPTNLETKYLRNYVRHNVITKMSAKQKEELLSNIDKVAKINKMTDEQLATISQNVLTQERLILREKFAALPADIGKELVIYWLRQLHAAAIDKKMVQRLSTAIKVAPAGTLHDVDARWKLALSKSTAQFRSSFQNY